MHLTWIHHHWLKSFHHSCFPKIDWHTHTPSLHTKPAKSKVQIPPVLSSQVPQLHLWHEATGQEEGLANLLLIQQLPLASGYISFAAASWVPLLGIGKYHNEAIGFGTNEGQLEQTQLGWPANETNTYQLKSSNWPQPNAPVEIRSSSHLQIYPHWVPWATSTGPSLGRHWPCSSWTWLSMLLELPSCPAQHLRLWQKPTRIIAWQVVNELMT